MRKLKCAVFILFFAAMCLAQNKQETFTSVKQKYLNRKIVIIEKPVTEIFSSWHLVTWPDLKPKKAEKLFDDYLPTSYAGRPATVVSIVISDNPILSKKPKANALGEMPSDDQIIDPYVEFFVRFDDGTTAQWSTSASTAYLSIKALPDTQQLQSEIQANAESLIGKTLYAVHNSYLYSADTEITEMVSSVNVGMMDSDKFPFLTPLTITASRYLPNYDALIIKLRLPDGTEVLALTSGESIQSSKAPTFIGKVAGTLLPSIPAWLTPQEIAAIKRKQIFKGMRRKALLYVVGEPDRVNTSSVGDSQLIFGGLYIYVNHSGIVTNWQSRQ